MLTHGLLVNLWFYENWNWYGWCHYHSYVHTHTHAHIYKHTPHPISGTNKYVLFASWQNEKILSPVHHSFLYLRQTLKIIKISVMKKQNCNIITRLWWVWRHHDYYNTACHERAHSITQSIVLLQVICGVSSLLRANIHLSGTDRGLFDTQVQYDLCLCYSGTIRFMFMLLRCNTINNYHRGAIRFMFMLIMIIMLTI